MSEDLKETESAQSKRERQRARKAAAQAAQAEAKKAEQKKTTLVVIAIIAAVAVVLAGAYYLMTKSSDVTLGMLPVSVEGEELPMPDPPSENDDANSLFTNDNAVGKTVPTIKGTDFDGQEHIIGKGSGKPQAIAVIAHWCPHCQREVKEAKDWVKNGQIPEGIELIALVTENNPRRPNWPPTDWLKNEQWPGLAVYDAPLTDNTHPGGKAVGIASFPTWIFTDADGKVVGRVAGAIGGDIFKEFADKTLAAAK
ncbi:TlpA family protein disulfide reductase [Stomatohabitans albus]|uniref:TlpA family protein disulfide reductase n=1 Tax=Stomatohabitans albus TaxID=3110766 RepID=UPI00300C4081